MAQQDVSGTTDNRPPLPEAPTSDNPKITDANTKANDEQKSNDTSSKPDTTNDTSNKSDITNDTQCKPTISQISVNQFEFAFTTPQFEGDSRTRIELGL